MDKLSYILEKAKQETKDIEQTKHFMIGSLTEILRRNGFEDTEDTRKTLEKLIDLK